MEELIYGKNVKDGDIITYSKRNEYSFVIKIYGNNYCSHYLDGKNYYKSGGGAPQTDGWALATKWQAETLRLSIEKGTYTEADENLFSKTEFEYPSGYLIDKIEQPVDIDFLN